jgi:hypothetical protein
MSWQMTMLHHWQISMLSDNGSYALCDYRKQRSCSRVQSPSIFQYVFTLSLHRVVFDLVERIPFRFMAASLKASATRS